MKISYVAVYDANNVNSWSGLGYHIAKSLENASNQVEYIHKLNSSWKYALKLKQFAFNTLGKEFLWEREPVVLKGYAATVKKQLNQKTDIIFSPGTLPVAYLDSKKPIVFYTDSIFAGLIDYYPSFSNLTRSTIHNGNAAEQEALNRCSMAIYSSTWAADIAVRHYKVNPAKIQVLPFGANIESKRSYTDIAAAVKSRPANKCVLLFLAVDWERKGGDKALKIAQLLNESGLETELHLVGIKKPPIKELPPYVFNHGFVDKKSEEGRLLIDKLLMQSHFLVLPTLADCTPIVFSEACSFGLPSLTTNTGGISSVITNNVNGFTFDLNAGAEEYAAYIMEKFQNANTYRELCLSSFNEYETRLNWNTTGKKLTELICQL